MRRAVPSQLTNGSLDLELFQHHSAAQLLCLGGIRGVSDTLINPFTQTLSDTR